MVRKSGLEALKEGKPLPRPVKAEEEKIQEEEKLTIEEALDIGALYEKQNSQKAMSLPSGFPLIIRPVYPAEYIPLGFMPLMVSLEKKGIEELTDKERQQYNRLKDFVCMKAAVKPKIVPKKDRKKGEYAVETLTDIDKEAILIEVGNLGGWGPKAGKLLHPFFEELTLFMNSGEQQKTTDSSQA